MRPATIRRLLVFGVCLVGVGCLYLVPSRAGAPDGVGSTAVRSDLQTDSAPSPTVVTAISAEPTGNRSALVAQTGSVRSSARPSIRQQTADERSLPPQVGRLTLVSADPQRLVVSWPDVDDADLVGYEVWLNGFYVVTVQQPRARLAWFNDSDTHVIQVRALDAAGQEGPASPTLLVTRPTPAPDPAASESTPPSASPDPTRTTSTAPTTPEAGDSRENVS